MCLTIYNIHNAFIWAGRSTSEQETLHSALGHARGNSLTTDRTSGGIPPLGLPPYRHRHQVRSDSEREPNTPSFFNRGKAFLPRLTVRPLDRAKARMLPFMSSAHCQCFTRAPAPHPEVKRKTAFLFLQRSASFSRFLKFYASSLNIYTIQIRRKSVERQWENQETGFKMNLLLEFQHYYGVNIKKEICLS